MVYRWWGQWQDTRWWAAPGKEWESEPEKLNKNYRASYRARICRSFKETRNQFLAWRAGTKPSFSYWPARLQRLAKSIPRNQFLSFIKVYKYGLWSGQRALASHWWTKYANATPEYLTTIDLQTYSCKTPVTPAASHSTSVIWILYSTSNLIFFRNLISWIILVFLWREAWNNESTKPVLWCSSKNTQSMKIWRCMQSLQL